MRDKKGRLIAGRYRLEHPIGRGAMGTVWRAIDERLRRAVAVKRLRARPGSSEAEQERDRRRALREAQVAGRLQHHPHAVTVFDAVYEDDGPALVMEYLPSQTLAQVLDEQGPLEPGRVAAVGAAVASALAAAHELGIVHRDVKPANILLGAEDTKITDFGVARAPGDVTVTAAGMLTGTPNYLAPETARGQIPTKPSDVFSLGATLYAAVEGTPPFGSADNAIAQLHRVAEGHVNPPRQAGPLTALLMRMLNDDPAERPTMAEVATSLAAIAETTQDAVTERVIPVEAPARTRLDLRPLATIADVPAVVAPPPPVVRRSPRAVRRSTARRAVARRSYTPVAIGVLVVVLLTLLLITLNNDPGTTPQQPAGTSAPPPAPDPAVFQKAVVDYYTALPEDTDRAWALLGPDLRNQDRKKYEKHWDGIKDLALTGPPEVNGTTVTARIEYPAKGGRVQETHQLTLLLDNGVALINVDQLLDSRTVKGR
ncbi:serine/threonine-protein kinase [Actinokineospora sp. HUAS TT18]|uniref:serine/threonine-protein kinase n=1 Tax=Actinokineospora sp. HUAS TT18 TaxID=3447451 RepID=UPI003F520221